MFEGIFIGSEKYPKLNEVLNRLAETYDTTPNGIAVAWILRHPAGIQTIVGTMNEKRLADIAKAADLVLTREEWYLSLIHICPGFSATTRFMSRRPG